MSDANDEEEKASITEGHLKKVLLADKGSGAHLLSWTIRDFTKKGDNYANIVTSVIVIYKVNDGSEHKVTYVVKLNINRGSNTLSDIMTFGIEREARFLKELLPEFSSLLVSVGEDPLRIPKCYHISLEPGKEMIFMEDLRARGFKMFDRKRGLDVAHTTLILQELARLHAASLMLRHSGRHATMDIVKDISSGNWTNYNKNAQNVSRNTFRSSIENAVTMLENVSGYEQAIKWLLELKPKAFEILEDQHCQCDPFVVFCHGDCWTNNFLFRYNEENIPVEAMLVDPSLTRYASPAIDLNYFMLTNLNTSDRRENLDSYLDTYHLAFRKTMEAGGLQMPFSRQQLEDEYKNKHLYGILMTTFAVPLFIVEDDAVVDIGMFMGNEPNEEQKRYMRDMANTNPLFRPRYLGIFDEMMEKSVIT